MQIELHFHRPGKPCRVFSEELVEDDGTRLCTRSIVPAEFAQTWTRSYQRQGLIPPGSLIHSVRKYHFYSEYFGIMQLCSLDENVLGWYVDIATPLVRSGNTYHRTDLFLDLWLGANGQVVEMDLDEFADAVNTGLIQGDMETAARSTLVRLEREIELRIFPGRYVSES